MRGDQVRPELQDIVDEASRLLRASTTLEDRDYNLIAFAAQHGPVDIVRQVSILQRTMPDDIRVWFEQFPLGESPGPLRTPADPERGILPRICFPIRWRGVTYGFLWALDGEHALDEPVVAEVATLAEHAGAYLSQLSRQYDEDGVVVADLLGTDADAVRRSAVRIADRGRIPHDVGVACIVAGCWHPDAPDDLPLNLAMLPKQVLADRGPRSTTILVPVEPSDARRSAVLDTARTVLDLYARRLPEHLRPLVVAGVGEVKPSMLRARESWMEARQAARVATVAPEVRPVAEWRHLGLYRLVGAAPDPELWAALVDPDVRRLLDAGDPALVETVRAYLDRGGRAQDTAAALTIHRQTLYYRLAKAERITGLSLADGVHRTRLHTALMLAPLVRPAG